MIDGDELWAWQVQEPDGKWSMVGALLPDGLGGARNTHAPLIHRRLDVVQMMRDMAEGHARATGQPLRLAHFKLTEVVAR